MRYFFLLLCINSLLFGVDTFNNNATDSAESLPFALLTMLAILFASILVGSLESSNNYHDKLSDKYSAILEERELFVLKNSIEIGISAEPVRLHSKLNKLMDKLKFLEEKNYEL